MKHEHTIENPDLIIKAMSLLRRVGSATNEWHRSTVEQGFTVNQAMVLHHLVHHGDATPSDLAAWMHITRGSVTPTIKRLEDLGLLTREIDEDDGRKQWLRATPEAREISDEVEAEVLHPAFDEFASWPEADLKGFVNGLERLLSGKMLAGSK